MVTSPQTQSIIDAIVLVLKNATYPVGTSAAYHGVVTDSTPVYANVYEGGLGDITDSVPCACVLAMEDDSTHYAFGGMMQEVQGFQVMSLVSYTDKKVAQRQIAAIRDTIMPLFQKRAALGGIDGVDDARVKPGSAAFGFYLDGKVWRGHTVTIVANTKYSIPNGITP